MYAVDGIQFTLPRSEDIISNDYSGRKVSKYRESYMPKMFAVGALDVLNGTVKDFREHPTLNEPADALDMIPGLEEESLTIYDRMYCNKGIVRAHRASGNHFLFRLRKSVCKEMKVIFKGRKKRRTVVVEGVSVELFKIKNPKTGHYSYFATSLPPNEVDEKIIRGL